MTKKFCAHRGVSALMPENTLPAFAAAHSLGADEIEFDVRLTKDNKLIVSHDDTLERISNGKGKLNNYTLNELQKLNIGVERCWNAVFCTAEEVFELLANKIVFNIHIKEYGANGFLISELARLIDKYNASENCYFAAAGAELEQIYKIAPQIKRTAIQFPTEALGVYEAAKKYGCSGVQFWLGMFDKTLIEQLHAENIRCNLFFADNAEDYEKYFSMGIDTILTNRMDLAAAYKRNNPSNFILA